ncbi:putative transposase [Sulfurisphaera tokodaii str. 7]|uniref:Transposase n=1 Tax=Sulfurisphaera tokodaii (strain DSM 16993 / JCM 10545 / NBRC 100140 / 7) TaxID=273063 RepID=Q972R7_SULTO|nr:putative transposase [Sulfurisphaera tokodaii str. 7]
MMLGRSWFLSSSVIWFVLWVGCGSLVSLSLISCLKEMREVVSQGFTSSCGVVFSNLS